MTDYFGSTLRYGLITAVPVEIGGGVSGIYGVDFDGSVAKLPGKLHGHHIEHGLGAVVAERLDGGKGPVGIGIPGKGSVAKSGMAIC